MATDSPRPNSSYRGRLAPSPTGLLHLGHARTFWIAQERARQNNGVLVLRNEDLDPTRCQADFVEAMMEDLRWFGFEWHEGPDVGGPHGPYVQSQRFRLYRAALDRLIADHRVYPCICSRKDILNALSAPHGEGDEPLYPGTCRQRKATSSLSRFSWRFRVPDGEAIEFEDRNLGSMSFVGGKDFGDFVVWRHDGVPSYQLAVVVDDAAMHITEVVRGADLLISTARQILLYRALRWTAPDFFHCPLMTDSNGVRLAKRHDGLALRSLRKSGATPAGLREQPEFRFVGCGR